MFGRPSREQLRSMIRQETEAIQLAELQALEIKPEQTIIARFPKKLTSRQIDVAGRNLRRAFPVNRIAIFEEGGGLQIVGQKQEGIPPEAKSEGLRWGGSF